MAFKIFGRESVPKVFQTFNSLLGGIVRKRNATIVGPSKQLVGEFPEVDFERLYQYYHHWPQVKTAIDVMHQKFRGSGISIKSNNEYFNVFVEKWWDISNAEKKFSQFIFSLLITGSAIMELQYTPDKRIGNIEQIPMQTIYRVFRDQFGNELKIVQIVDGVFKELDPEFFIHQTINNPDRQAFGKSMFHTLASPRPIAGTVDPFTGEAINPARQAISILDAQAELLNAEIEIKKKMAKPRLIVSANGMPKDQMEKIQAEMSDPNTAQYIWIFDKPVDSKELQVQANGRFDEYQKNIDNQVDIAMIFASEVIKNPQGFSYSGGQTPFDVLDQRMMDLQTELLETIKDRLLKPLAESWGFMDFDAMEVEVQFTPTMKRLTMEDISGLDPEAVSKKEKREMYKKLNIPLDDQLFEEEQNELKADKQDQKNIQMQSAITGAVDPTTGKPASVGGKPSGGDKPFESPEDKAKKPNTAGNAKEPKTGDNPKTPFEQDRPKPVPMATGAKRPQGENLHSRLIKQIANENLTPKQMIEAIKAVERIPLPPKAGSDVDNSSDLYVSQGIDDEEDSVPEITDPAVRDEFGLDKQDSETPPSDPSKMARGGDRPALQPADNTQGRFTNNNNQGIPQTPVVSEEEYMKHLEASNNGNAIQGGTGNDGINQDSDGSFKDPVDATNTMERTPETGNTAIPNPHPRPNQKPLVGEPVQMSGGSDAQPDNTNKQVIGGNNDDEDPIVPSEGFPEDNDKKKSKKLQDSQNITEAVNPNSPFAKPKKDIKIGEDPLTTGIIKEDDDEQRIDAIAGNTTDNTSEEQPIDLSNDENNPDNPLPQPFDKIDNTNNNIGDSNQQRLQNTELTGQQQDPLKPNNGILDNTGLNVTPEYKQVSEDDYMKRVQDGSNPLEQNGDPLQDGMIIKPEDTQQFDGKNKPIAGNPTAINQNNNTMNDPTDSGIDEEEVDPNILHYDPETGRNYTDLTDEQGEPVPDLRWDQTPSSDEEQPEVELKYEIVTKEEYEQHLGASKNTAPVNGLEQPLEQQPLMDDPLDPIEKDTDGNPMELQNNNDNINDSISEEHPITGDLKTSPEQDNTFNSGQKTAETPKGDSSPKGKSEKSQPASSKSDKKTPDINDDNMSGSAPNKKEPTSKKKTNPRNKKDTKEKSKKSDKKEKNTAQDELDTEDLPETKGDVDNIIKREHELIDKGIPEDEIHDILLDEFGDDNNDQS